MFAPSTHARGVRIGGGVEVNDLPVGMNARVGAAGADGDDGFGGDECERILHRVLQRGRVRLRLPAGIVGAVILDERGDAPGVATPAAVRHR